MSAHCGTHADAPSHVFADGKAIGEAPLAAYVGPARVVELPGSARSGPDALPAQGARARRASSFAAAARRRCRRSPRMRLAEAGRDARRHRRRLDRPGGRRGPAGPPRALLGSGVALLEDLDLDGVPEGTTSSSRCRCGSEDLDASPVRAILIEDRSRSDRLATGRAPGCRVASSTRPTARISAPVRRSVSWRRAVSATSS